MKIKINKLTLEIVSLLFLKLFYLWYFLPVINTIFSAERYKLLFFSFFIAGTLGIVIVNKGKIFINKVTTIALLYCAAILFLSLFGIKEASKHVRIGLMFYSSLFLFCAFLDSDQRKNLGQYLLVLFLITIFTSGIVVFIDNTASRAMTQASIDPMIYHKYGLLNVGDIYLFQCIVMCVPAVYFLLKNRPVIRLCVLLLMGMLVLKGSFSISIVLFVFAITLVIYQNYSKNWESKLIMLFVYLVAVIAIYIVGFGALTYLSGILGNTHVSKRIIDIRNLVYGINEFEGSLSLRLSQYFCSWETFLANPLGIGPYYSYKAYENGIGYHSHLFDDLARYGLFSIGMYTAFFVEYYRMLKKEWKKIESSEVALSTTLLYFLFLLFNIGMRSGIESVVMTFIIPILPEMILSNKKNLTRSKKK